MITIRRRRRTARIEPRPPLAITALSLIAIIFFALPFFGLLWRAPWSSAWALLSDPDSLTALRLSIQCSLIAAALAVVFGVPLAWVLARRDFVRCQILSRKISKKHISEKGLEAQKVQYFRFMVSYYVHERMTLDTAKAYQIIYDTFAANPEELDKSGNERS